MIKKLTQLWQRNRVKTPTVLQMEAAECGAAALGIILAHYGLYAPLEELRINCGVSRDGSRASNVVKAARRYGLDAKGYRREIDRLMKTRMPCIIFWNFNHFLVVEGFGRKAVYLNDPASGRRTVTYEEFDKSFTGVVLEFDIGPDFKRGGGKHTILPSLWSRLKGNWPGILYVLLAGLGTVCTGLVLPAFSRIFVDEILIRGENWIGPLLIGMAFTAVMRGIFTWLQQYFILRLESKISIGTSSQLFLHLFRLPTEFFTQRFSGEISSRVALNSKVAQLLSTEMATTTLNLLLVGVYIVVMIQYDPLLTGLGVGIALLNLIVLGTVSRMHTDANQLLLQESGKLMGVTMNGLYQIETLKANGAEDDFFSQWAGYQAKTLNAQQKLGLSGQVLSIVPLALGMLSTAAVLSFGGLQVLSGKLTVGMLVAFQSLMASFLRPVAQFVNLNATLQEIDGSLKRLDDVLHHKPDPSINLLESPPLSKERTYTKLSGKLELRNVTFGYSKFAPPLIENFNLTLKPGQRIALVGSSGSGKSTVAKLVAGLYQPWEGNILFDDHPREWYPRQLLASSLAMVDQDILLFDGSIRNNLTLWDSSIPESDIIQAAQDAAIHKEISARRGGYRAYIEEGGRNFSGGQRQRLEIARALAHNPTLLVLDEATSALDPITEQIIDRNLRRRGCSILVVAHRLSTIRDSDEIIVLRAGRIVERGTHDELIQGKGHYARLLSSEDYETSRTKLESILEALN